MKKPFAKTILLKDVYEKIKKDEITKRQFMEWLKLYRYKHWDNGWNDADKFRKTIYERE